MVDNFFADSLGPVTATPDCESKYTEKYGLSREEFYAVEMVTNTLAQVMSPIKRVDILKEGDSYVVSLYIPNDIETNYLFKIIRTYIDPDVLYDTEVNALTYKYHMGEQAKCFIQWIKDYSVPITEFNY